MTRQKGGAARRPGRYAMRGVLLLGALVPAVLFVTAPAGAADPSADLSVTKIGVPDPAPLEGELTYVLTVTNAGPDPATATTLTDVLPASVSLLSAQSSQGTCTSGTTVGCALGTLASGASATVVLVTQPQATGPVTNSATVAATETDPVPTDNSATTTTTVTDNPGCTITGTPGDDVLPGTPGDDVICGLGGRDVITAGAGDDTVFGGAGDDVITGGPGDDVLVGGSGADRISGGAGDDTVTAGTGHDVVQGETGDDTITTVDGPTFRDVATGGPGNDTCTADAVDVVSC